MSFTLQPAVRENFVNREKIISEIIDTLTDRNVRMGFALTGPRRIGKTSILKEVVDRLSGRKDVVAIYFSLWELVENTPEELYRKLSNAILEAFKRRLSRKYSLSHMARVPAEKIIDFLRTIDFRISLFDDLEMTLKLPRKEFPDTGTLLEQIFGLLENVSKDVATRSVLILDEFPSITDLKDGRKIGEGIIRKIRTIHEGLEHTVLCVSGSIRKTMELAVLSPSSAFYRQFIVKNIEPFDRATVDTLIRMNMTGRVKTDALQEIYTLTRGIPFYVQFIGRELSRIETPVIRAQEVRVSYENLLREEGGLLFTEAFKVLSDKEKALLVRMALDDMEKPGSVRKALGLESNVVSRYMVYFLEKGILQRISKGTYTFTDPLFRDWLKRRFG